MKKVLQFVFVALIYGSLLAQAPTGMKAVKAELESRRRSLDYRLAGKLLHISEAGLRESHKFSMRARSFGDGTKVFFEIIEPARARIRVLLESDSSGTTIKVGRPGDRKAQLLAFSEWQTPLLDSDLSYEDLLDTYSSWEKQELVTEDKCGARECYVIKSEPGARDLSHYSSVTSWLDKHIYYPIRIEKKGKSSGLIKEFVFFNLRQSKGLWSPSQIQVRTKNHTETSFFIISGGSGKAKVAAEEFDSALLIKR
jgi:hypothetical protein